MDTTLQYDSAFFLDNVTANGSSNVDILLPPWKLHTQLAYKIMVAILLCVVMVAMGCEINMKEIWQHIRGPRGVGIGVAGQMVVLPLMGFGLACGLRLRADEAIGLMIIACSPGGSMSNVFTYWVRGIVSLSVTMTTVSTVLAFGSMPLNLWLYTRRWTSDSTVVPYISIFLALVSILVPLAVGQLIRWRMQKVAKITIKFGSVAGMLCVIVLVIMQFVLYPSAFRTRWQLLLAVFLLPLVAFLLVYLLAYVQHQPHDFCRTVALETSCQNIGMATAVILISFDYENSARFCIPVIMYGIMLMVEYFLFLIGLSIHRKWFAKFDPVPTEDNINVKDVTSRAHGEESV